MYEVPNLCAMEWIWLPSIYNAMSVGDDNSSIIGTECPLRNETDDDTKPVS